MSGGAAHEVALVGRDEIGQAGRVEDAEARAVRRVRTGEGSEGTPSQSASQVVEKGL
jgi:hypothetical protein